MPDPLLELRGLKTGFPTRAGEVKAVDDVSFALHRGKVLADTTPAQLVDSAGGGTIEEAFLALTGSGERAGQPSRRTLQMR